MTCQQIENYQLFVEYLGITDVFHEVENKTMYVRLKIMILLDSGCGCKKGFISKKFLPTANCSFSIYDCHYMYLYSYTHFQIHNTVGMINK